MGTDISGWVEIQMMEPPDEYWSTVIIIDSLLGRNYDMFALLFGVRNSAGFLPLAEQRGFPLHIALKTKELAEENLLESISWIGWWEIQLIDWTIKSTLPTTVSYIAQNGSIERVIGNLGPLADEIQKEYITREDALDENWQLLFGLMEQLGQRFGNESVRLVVGFDA